VTAVEINTTWHENEVHVLGYNVPTGASAVGDMLAYNRRERRIRAEEMVHRLRAAGYGITFDDVLREAGPAESIGRPHVAKALVRGGQTTDINTAFRDILRRGRPGYVPQTYTSPIEAIARIASDGGIPVLAHPGRLKDRSLIDALAREGLQGLEVFYPLHEPGDVAEFEAKAREHGLVMTAGMDFHDIRYHTQGVGIDVSDDAIRPFLELAGAISA
jgi:predicted metal-dependent phosphoesterase TrpH